MPSTLPQLPERYADARLVARGGMGEVWRARDTRLGRDVALKVLPPGDGTEPEATRRERFLREARAIAQLSSHQNVVTVYDAGEQEGALWLALEWLPAGDLAQRLAEGDIDHDDAVRWLEQAAAGLDAAHRAGIVHRDVKPANILFDGQGDVRIGDFGIARWSQEPTSMLTLPGAVIGTASYMSPEQARGEPVTAASDQYSLMVIGWQLLVGSRPFERDSAVAELAAHASEPPPAASAAAPGIPPAVDRVFERALAKLAADRFETCSDAVAALRAALAAPTPSAVAPTVPLRASRPVRRRRTVTWSPARIAVVALVALALVGAVAMATADGGGDGARTTPTDTAPSAPNDTPAKQRSEPVVDEPSDEERRATAIARHEAAYQLLQEGRFQEALELSRLALRDLSGVAPYEAYANYNVGASLLGLGRCAEAIPFLDESERLQGHRSEIEAARAEAQACLQGGKGDKDDKRDKGDKDEGRGDDD